MKKTPIINPFQRKGLVFLLPFGEVGRGRKGLALLIMLFVFSLPFGKGWGWVASAQNKKLDSLLTLIKTDKEDTNKVNHLKKVCWKYNLIGEYAQGLSYGKQALTLAQNLGYKKGIGACCTNIGNIYWHQSNYPKALEYCLKSLKIQEEIKDKHGIASCYANIGNIYTDMVNYPKALEYFLKALPIFEEFDDKRNMGACYVSMGSIYQEQTNLPKALDYFLKALQLFEEVGDKKSIGACYGNIGNIYTNQVNYSKALAYYLKALPIFKEFDDIQGIGYCYVSMGNLYIKLANYKIAKQYCDSAFQVCKETGDIDNERLAYANLADVYSKTNRYKEAYESHVKFKTLTDSIFNADNSKQLGDLKTKFEVEKKESELKIKAEAQEAIAQEEKQKQRIVLSLVSCLLVFVAIFSVFMYRRFKITQRQKAVIEKQKALVDVKNKEIEHQKKIVEEHHKDIIDSINYAERIQRSFIATKELLDENLTTHPLTPSQKEGEVAIASPSLREGFRMGGADYFVFFKPKDIVSGDFYWASKLSNGNFALATADSTGHGVPGAIMSLLNVTSLEKAIENNTQPADILNYTRKIIIERLKKDGSAEGGKDGMDCSLIVFEASPNPSKGGEFHTQVSPFGGIKGGCKLIVAAANNPVWIVRNNSPFEGGKGDVEVIEIKPDKMPVGKHDKQANSFTQQEIALQCGDVVYTLTDGFPDQFGGDKGKKFMSKNLRELLAANAHLPMQAQKELLDKTFTDWVGNLEQVDDVTLIGVRV